MAFRGHGEIKSKGNNLKSDAAASGEIEFFAQNEATYPRRPASRVGACQRPWQRWLGWPGRRIDDRAAMSWMLPIVPAFGGENRLKIGGRRADPDAPGRSRDSGIVARFVGFAAAMPLRSAVGH